MFKKLLMVFATLVATMGFAFAQIDVNKADQAALDAVKGIGPVTSKAIIDERKKGGNFKDWADFEARVSGVGDKKGMALSQAGLTVNGAKKSGTAAANAADAKKDAKADAKELKKDAKAEAKEVKKEAKAEAKEVKAEAKKDASNAKASADKNAAVAKAEVKKDAAVAKAEVKKDAAVVKAEVKKDEKAAAAGTTAPVKK